MNSNSLVDWLEYINLNRSEEGQFGLKRLEPIKNLVLDSPIAKKVVVIGGTNGKGTTAEFLNNLLLQSDFKVGLYTSPHLFNFNERIRMNGLPVSDLDIIKAFNLKPSKQIGEIKDAIKDAIMEGVIPNNRDAAIAFMKEKASDFGLILINEIS